MATDPVGGDEVGDDRLFEALAHDRRQRVLDVLDDAETTLSLSDLARGVARRENARQPGVDGETVRRVRLSLYHWHVPKLADVGLVDYDADRKTVRLETATDRPDDRADLLPLHTG